MDWLEISVTTKSEEASEIAEVILMDFAVDDEGVSSEQHADPERRDPFTLAPDITTKLNIRIQRDNEALRNRIEEALGAAQLPAPEFRRFKNEDWQNAWKAYYHPVEVGERFLIQPSWESEVPYSASRRHAIILDPGLAFGTGTHETTQLCIELMEQVLLPNQSVLDLGTGSGILAIAADKQGAGSILAIDNDPKAVASANENAERNGSGSSIRCLQGSLSEAGNATFDLVFANILAPVLLDMLEHGLQDRVAAGGHLILSGILEEFSGEILNPLRSKEANVISHVTKGKWCALLIKQG